MKSPTNTIAVSIRARTSHSRLTAAKSIARTALTIGFAIILGNSLALAADSDSEELAHAAWRESIIKMETPYEGCFQATFPNTRWQEVSCRTVGTHTHPLPRRAGPGEPQTTGNGNDYALVAGGLISSTVGSFPSVSGVTSESSVGVPAFGDGGILGSNEYSLQINTNANSSTSACSGGVAGCKVWQQYVYATDYETKGSAAVFMEYWLLGYGSSCPSGGGYILSGSSCVKNSAYISAPNVAITGLGNLKITGTAVPGGNDTVTFANGTQAYSVSALDTVLEIGTVWNEAEFNIVGDAGGSDAVFNAGAVVPVKVAAQYGSTAAPSCASNAGTTGETNSLTLGSCVAMGGATPSIQFTESSADTPVMTQGTNNATENGFTTIGADPIGSMNPAKTSNGYTYQTFKDVFRLSSGHYIQTNFVLTGFTANPGQAWLTSAGCNGTTRTGASATYSYTAGAAEWVWTTGQMFGTDGNVNCTILHN